MTDIRFFIAQYISDPFRREQRNVGLIVVSGPEWRAKFFAEDTRGGIDRRRARSILRAPDVYEQWVQYWRETLARNGASAVEQFLDVGRVNFRVIEGGEMEHSTDDLTTVSRRLYSMLVAEDAVGDATAKAKVQSGLKREFLKRSILQQDKSSIPPVPHPVRPNWRVAGKDASHRPSFVQENGELCVIETLECTTSTTEWRLKERAGFAAYMFDDIRTAQSKRRPVKAVAVYNISDDLRDEPAVKYALRIAGSSADLVDWSDAPAREAFLDERQATAG